MNFIFVHGCEAAQPKSCPKCNAAVWTFLEPFRVAHDVEKCARKSLKKISPIAKSSVGAVSSENHFAGTYRS
jgi:hypothetical protein